MKERFTHKMHKAYFSASNKGVVWEESAETGEFIRRIPAENLEFQYEAVYPLVIEKIEKGDSEMSYTQEWLDELPEMDVKKIEDAVRELRTKTAEAEEGKKKSD